VRFVLHTGYVVKIQNLMFCSICYEWELKQLKNIWLVKCATAVIWKVHSGGQT